MEKTGTATIITLNNIQIGLCKKYMVLIRKSDRKIKLIKFCPHYVSFCVIIWITFKIFYVSMQHFEKYIKINAKGLGAFEWTWWYVNYFKQ